MSKHASPCVTAFGWRPSAHDLPECDDLAEVMRIVNRDMRDRVGNGVVRQQRKLDWRIDSASRKGLIAGDFHRLLKTFKEPLTYRLPFVSRSRRPTE